MAHPAVGVAIIVGSQASVIIDLLPGCASRRSVESVATFTADQHALQQCRFDGAPRRETLVLLKSFLCQGEGIFIYD